MSLPRSFIEQYSHDDCVRFVEDLLYLLNTPEPYREDDYEKDVEVIVNLLPELLPVMID